MSISIQKARELLGKTGEKMTDEQIIKVEDELRYLADIIIDTVIKMTPKERKALDEKIKRKKNEKQKKD